MPMYETEIEFTYVTITVSGEYDLGQRGGYHDPSFEPEILSTNITCIEIHEGEPLDSMSCLPDDDELDAKILEDLRDSGEPMYFDDQRPRFSHRARARIQQ